LDVINLSLLGSRPAVTNLDHPGYNVENRLVGFKIPNFISYAPAFSVFPVLFADHPEEQAKGMKRRRKPPQYL